MGERYRPASYHRVVTISLLLLNLIAIVYAIVEGGTGRWDFHFRDGASFVTWFGSAQMLGAALLFVACYFSGTIIRLEGEAEQENGGWLVFALGFFVLAIDQQFRLREYLTYLIDGSWPTSANPSSTTAMLKALAAAAAVGLVVYYRSTVLSNFRMVITFMAGFWFLLIMLLVHMLVEAVGLPSWLGKVLEGSGKLLALAMFLSGSYIALLDRLSAANAAAQLGLYGERRQKQIPIGFPERRGHVEFGPLSAAEPEAVPSSEQSAASEAVQAEPVAAAEAKPADEASETSATPTPDADEAKPPASTSDEAKPAPTPSADEAKAFEAKADGKPSDGKPALEEKPSSERDTKPDKPSAEKPAAEEKPSSERDTKPDQPSAEKPAAEEKASDKP